MNHVKRVQRYYRTLESRLGYRLMLNDDRHFGYYPSQASDSLSMHQAQELMNDKLYEALLLPRKSKVLDAGSGNGNVAIYLAEKYDLRVTGIDLIPSNRKNSLAKRQHMKHPSRVDFVLGDYSQLPYTDKSFDGLYTMETFVHAHDPLAVLGEFFRVLKPGGRLVLHEYYMCPENAKSAEQKEALRRLKRLNIIAAMPMLNENTKGNLGKLAGKAGFKAVETRDYSAFAMPMMRLFGAKARTAFTLAQRLGMEKFFDRHFVNAATAVISSEFPELVGYEVTIATKPR